MQLTNILRDVGEDWRRGRLYLPLDAIEAHGVDLSDLDRATVSPALQGVLREHIEQARAWYVEGLAGVGLLPARVRLPILVAGRLYRAILRQIEVNGYDVLTRRARTSRLQKITALIRASVTLGSIQFFTGTIRSVR
jgi:phytoene synthase